MHSAAAMTRPAGWNVCSRCLARSTTTGAGRMLYRSSIHTKRRLSGAIVPDDEVQKNMTMQSQPSFHDYFSSNTSIDRGWIKNGLFAAWQTKTMALREVKASNVQQHSTVQSRSIQDESASVLPDNKEQNISNEETQATVASVAHVQSVKESFVSNTDVLPHRRRRQRIIDQEDTSVAEQQLPLDASSQLTTAASELPTSATLRRKFATYLSLTKPRLSFLIVLTTTSAYSLYPIPDIISSATHAADASSTLSTTTLTLTFLSIGTFLASASANTFNMLFEPKYDAMMSRTRNRPLVRKLLSQRAALLFGVLCGGSGILLLYLGTNPTVAALSALNVFLYAGVYTPMKRLSPINTWVGAIVGGIPPLMGWCAAAGEAATSEHHSWKDLLLSEDAIGGWLLAALLFAWQFPHFNSLSHTIRNDYRQAGHKMLAWMNPAMNARVALRYSIVMFPICAGLYAAEIVNEGFLVISTACNAWMTKEAIRFWRNQGGKGSARGLFWASVWQLPLILVGALVCKTGIWSGFFGSDEDQPTSIYDDGELATGKDGPNDRLSALFMPSAIEGQAQTHSKSMLGLKQSSVST